VRWRRGQGRSSDVIDARGGGLSPRGGLGPRVALPGGLGVVGVILFLAIQVLSGGGAGAFGVDSQFGQAPQAPGAGARGIPAVPGP
jgi:hypothetical protein